MEYKFRGKRIDNGEWVYGFLFKETMAAGNKVPFIIEDGYVSEYGDIYQIDGDMYEVHPDSVGMDSGLNGHTFFEGDICKLRTYEAYDSDDYEVRFGAGKWEIHSEKKVLTHELYDYYSDLEVISNTTDNPELLKE